MRLINWNVISRHARLAAVVSVAMVAASGIGCSVQTDSGKNVEHSADTEQHISTKLLHAPQFFSATGTLKVSLKDETAEMYVNAADSSLMVNGAQVIDTNVTPNITAFAAGKAANIKTLMVIDDGTGTAGDIVILNYVNGLFGQGTSNHVGTTINLKASLASNSIIVKGTPGNDNFAIGGIGCIGTTGGSGAVSLTNAGGKVAPVKDISFSNLYSVSFAMGDGDDVFTSVGNSVIGAPFNQSCSTQTTPKLPMPVAIYGGNGNDTLFEGTDTATKKVQTPGETFSGGPGTDTVDYSGRTVAISVIIDPNGAVAPVDPTTLHLQFHASQNGSDGSTLCTLGTMSNAPPVWTSAPAESCAGLSAVNHTSGAGPVSVTLAGLTTNTPGNAAGETGNVDIYLYGDAFTAAKYTADIGEIGFSPALPNPYIDPTLGAFEGDVILDADVVLTGSGNDQLQGGPGGTTDTLNGGAGDDTFCQGADVPNNVIATAAIPGQSTDTIIGGSGINTVDYSKRQNQLVVTLDGSPTGGDTNANSGLGENDVVNTDVQNIRMGLGGGIYTGSSADNTFYSPDGAKSGQMSTVYGMAGDDLLDEGTDLAWQGSDSFFGGDGEDTISYARRTHGVFIIMDGNNVSGNGTNAAAAGIGVTLDPLTGIATWPAATVVTEGDIIGTDVEDAVGTPDNDLIIGNAGPNSLQGNGADALIGDTICGLGGEDILQGDVAASTVALTGGANHLHGYDCPAVITLNGTEAPTSGDGTTGDTVVGEYNACLNIGQVLASAGNTLGSTPTALTAVANNCSTFAQ